MFALLVRRAFSPRAIPFREYARRAPGSRHLPTTTSNLNPTAAFVMKDEPKQMVEPTVDPIADVMTSIKSATAPVQLLDSVRLSKSVVNKMQPDQFMGTLHSLFGLYKATKDSMSAAEIVGHPGFAILCRKLRRIAPSMDVSSNLNALKIINYLEIPANTELSLALLSLLRHQINDLSLHEMVYADFLLNQLKPRLEIVEALKAALPVLFEIQLPIQFDSENTSENIELLKFATSKMVSPKTVGLIADSLSKQLGHIEIEKRKEVLRVMCTAVNVPRTASELWDASIMRNANMIEQLEVNELLQSTGFIVRKCRAEPIFYTGNVGNYLNRCVNTFISHDTDLELAVYLQKLLKSISFKSVKLLQHIDNKINENIDSWPTAKLDIIFTVVQAFAMAAYRPANWKEAILPAILENVTNKTKNPQHPTWLQFTLQLILMDHFEVEFIERVLTKEYLIEYMQRNNFSDSDLLKTVILYHAAGRHGKCNIDHDHLQSIVGIYLGKQSENPFQNALTSKLGAKKCLFNVRTEYGHCIQNLLKYDIQKQEFTSFDAVQRDFYGFVQLDDISCKSKERLIAIDATPKHFYWTNSNELKNVYQLRRKQLQRNGLFVLEIPSPYWVKVPDAFEVRSDLLWQRIENALRHIT